MLTYACPKCSSRGWLAPPKSESEWAFLCSLCEGLGKVKLPLLLEEDSRTIDRVAEGRCLSSTAARIFEKLCTRLAEHGLSP